MTTRTLRWRALGLLLSATLLLPAVAPGAEPAAKAKARAKPAAQNAADDKPIFVQRWSDSLFAYVEKEYGAAAAKRFRHIQDVVLANQTKPAREKLEIANATINELPWVSDVQQWNADEYWATPFELIAKAGGDCEDMAIAKFVMLRMMGVPRRDLYLGYAQMRATGEIHMILVWTDPKRTEARILDNKVKEIKLAKARTDLQIVFLVDIDQNMILIEDDGTKKSIKAEVGYRPHARLQDLEKRVAEIRELGKKYNEGRPIFVN